jgi:hypothetical protein
MIGATTEHGTLYVGVQLREDNMNATMPSNHAGLMLLEQIPMTQVITISIGGKTVMHMAQILCNLWVVRKDGMKNPDVFVKSILDQFENEIIDHHTNIDADTPVIEMTSIQTLPSDSPELMRKAIMLTAWGYKVRP